MAIGSKGMTAPDLREKSDADLISELADAKETLFNLRFQAATGQLESHGRLKAVRRDIARIYTIMRERELGIITVVADEATVVSTEDAA
jgi:large subunit ribosomal protein L29